MLCL
ncbi:hypothetical protein D047_5128A, partial [Vibrio parahaemolyticus VPTS-2010_2]|jgi:hypothetical protein